MAASIASVNTESTITMENVLEKRTIIFRYMNTLLTPNSRVKPEADSGNISHDQY